MTSNLEGWTWIDPPADASDDSRRSREDGEDAVMIAFARCFATIDGQRVLAHLRRLTLDRTLGPATSDGVLRYLEGQRALVAHILTLVARGNLP